MLAGAFIPAGNTLAELREVKSKSQLKNYLLLLQTEPKEIDKPPFDTCNGKITFTANKIISRSVCLSPLQMTANSAGRTQFFSRLLFAGDNIKILLKYER